MDKVVKALVVLGVTATLVACGKPAPQEPVQIVPVQPEPVYNSKL